MSARKAPRERQMSDVLADALFLTRPLERMHQRSEKRLDTIDAVLSTVQECRGVASWRTIILTANRQTVVY